MPKNANGEGSIGKYRGRWVARATVQTPRGRRRRAFYGRTRAEARGKMLEAISQTNGGPAFEAGKLTFGDYLRRWLRDSARGSVKPNTLVRYEGNICNHIDPALGHILLRDLTAAHLQGLYSEKADQGLAPGTIRQMHAVAGRALKQAVKWRLIPHNPAEDADAPKLQPREVHTLSREQARQLLRAVGDWRGGRNLALFTLAISSGLRQGEMLGLRWEDLDLERGEARVARTVDTSQGYVRYGTPKTGKGRMVSLTDDTVAALRAHRKRQLEERVQAAEWKDERLVFASVSGDVIRRPVLYDFFQRLLRREGLPKMTFHELRHTCATLLLEGNVRSRVVQEMLGHADIRMTLGTYSHATRGMQDQAAKTMNELLS